MNYDRIIQEFRLRAADRRRAKLIAPEVYKEQCARLTALAARAKVLTDIRSFVAARVSIHHRMLDCVREVVAQPEHLIVAFDTGWTEDGPIEELGISLYRNGVHETVNIVAAETPKRHGAQCLFGPTIIMERDLIGPCVVEWSEKANIAVYHNANADLTKLGVRFAYDGRNKTSMGGCLFVDTAAIGGRWLKEGKHIALDELCYRYGIDSADSHISGNDARRTLEVLLKMIDDPTPFDVEGTLRRLITTRPQRWHKRQEARAREAAAPEQEAAESN